MVYACENSPLTDDNEKKAAIQELAKMVEAAEQALKNCEDFADKYGLEFNFEPAYGMGGTYTGKGISEKAEPEVSTWDWGTGSWGWYPSSQSC